MDPRAAAPSDAPRTRSGAPRAATGPAPAGPAPAGQAGPPLPAQPVRPSTPAPDLAETAAAFAADRPSANTRKTYGTAFRSLTAFLGEGATTDDLTIGTVAAWRTALQRAGRSPSTVGVYLSAVRQLADELGADPRIRRVRSERVHADVPQFLLPLELDRLLARPDPNTPVGIRDIAILQIAARAGLRRSEVAALTLRSIEKHRRLPDGRLRRAVPRSTAFAVRAIGPRDRERLVPLASSVLPALAAWRDERPEVDSEALFVSLPTIEGRLPGPLDPRDIGRIVARHAAAAGLPDDVRGVQVLRNTFARGLRRHGAGLETIRDLLGHEDIRTTQIHALDDQMDHSTFVEDDSSGPSALERL